MKFETSADVIELEIDGRKYTKVNYTRKEELLNCVTHGVGTLAYFCCMVYLMTISYDARTIIASLITCLSAITVYGVSTVYHAVQDTRKKYFWRKIDHSDIPFVVIGCSASMCLCLSTHFFNYVALGLSVFLAVTSIIMNAVSVDKFKVPTMIINFAIGIILFAAFMINFKLISQTVKYLYLSGAILCVVGSMIFGIKKRYMHSVFHVFVLVGTLCFYAAAVLVIQSYAGL